MTRELRGEEEVCKTNLTGSIPARVSITPTWIKFGAKSPQFDDVGKAMVKWQKQGRISEFDISELRWLCRWYEANFGALKLEFIELSKENSKLKRTVK